MTDGTTTTTTTEPVIDTIEEPATPGPTPGRGQQQPIDPPDGMCYVPQHLMDQYPMLNYVSCEELALADAPVLVDVPEATVAVAQPPVPMPVTELPATGIELTLAFIATSIIGVGAMLLAAAAGARRAGR